MLHLFNFFAIIVVLIKRIKLKNMNIYQYLAQLKFLEDPKVFFPVLAWIIFWKGLALWKAAGKKEVIWFWLLMIINTLGLLEICYLFVFSNPKNNLKDLKDKFTKKNLKNEEIITVEPIEENTNQE